MGREKDKKTYYYCSTFAPQKEIGDLVMLFNPIKKADQIRKFKSFYSAPQVIPEIKNYPDFVVEDVEKEKTTKGTLRSTHAFFRSRSANTDKKN